MGHSYLTVIADTLERRGALSDIRAKIRAEVFNALDDRSLVKPKPSNDTILINELIREYLEYNNYKYSATTLKAGMYHLGIELMAVTWFRM